MPTVAVKALGEAGSRLLLDDAQVIPAKLTEDGFVWAQPTITDAVRAISCSCLGLSVTARRNGVGGNSSPT